MTTVTLRQQKLSPLTNQEIDDNFSNLNTNKLESVVYPNLTTSGSGWYRVATTNTDGRGTYDLEVYTTGGNHDPSVLKIVAQCNWTGGRVLYAIWDGVFPASSVRVTRSASNSYLEVYFTTSVNTFAVRVNHTGFASGIVGYSGALSSGGDTVAETLALNSRLNISPGYIAGIDSNTVTNALGYTPYRAVTVEGAATAPANGLDAALQGWTAFDGYGTAVPNYPNNQWWVGAWTGGNSTRGVQLAGGYADSELYFRKGQDGWQSWKRIWHAGNLTNLNQLTNGPGYITGYTETDTLATVTGRGATTTTDITINKSGGGQVYLGRTHSEGGEIRLVSVGGDTGGWIQGHSGGVRTVDHSWTQTTWNIDNAGNSVATASHRAPVFYDSNDTGYYTDPASTSNMHTVTATNFRMGNALYLGSNNYYINNNSTWFGTNTSFRSDSDIRATIFYDQNDTGYYLNPNGVSHIYNLTVGTWSSNQSYPGVIITGDTGYNYNFNNGSWSGSVTAGFLANCADQWEFAVHDSGTRVVSPFLFDGGGNHRLLMGRDIGWGTMYIEAANSFRAPIFYDSNDTAYYVDPNSTSWGVYSAGGGRFRNIQISSSTYTDTIQQVSGGTLWLQYGHNGPLGLAYGGGTTTVYGPLVSSAGATVSLSNGPALTVTKSGSAPGNNTSMLVQSNYGDHSWGIVSEFRINGTAGTDRPSILLSTGYNTDTWSMGFGYYGDSNFRIKFDHGYRNGGWGTSALEIDRSRNVWAYGSMRSPIFYDNDDTNYYCDPHSSSRLNSTYTSQSYTYGWFRNYGAQGLYNEDYGNHWYATGNDYWNLAGNNGSQVGIILRTGGHQGTVRGYVYADSSNNVGFLNNGGSWRLRVVSGDYLLADGSSMRAPLYYDSNDTGYYSDQAGTSRLNYIDTNDGNLQLYKTQAVDMSDTSVYSTSNYYPVIISVPTSGCWIEIQNNLNTNVPSWSTHGSGFSLNLRWWTNGSGWGTTEVKRRVEQYHERFTNQTICGGISQLTHSSEEVVWLRGGGYYRFYFSRNLTAYPQSTSYTNAGLTASVTSTAVNTVWDSATGAHTSYNTSVFADTRIDAPIFYDRNNTSYYLNPDSTSYLYNVDANFLNFRSHFDNYGPGYWYRDDTQTVIQTFNTSASNASQFNLRHSYGSTILEAQRGDLYLYGSASIANNSLRAPIFYDSNDTGYYCDPNNTNRLNFVNSNNHYIQPGYMLYSDFGGWTGEYNKIQWHSTSLYLQSAGGGNLLILRRGDGGERFWCDYNGNVTASGNITAYSDQRLKTNIETIANPLELVNKLRGVTFDWIETGKHSYGLIAQEVEQVIPELVLETTNGNTETDVSTTVKSVDYSKLVSVLIEAVKEQQQQIDKLTKLVETLLAK